MCNEAIKAIKMEDEPVTIVDREVLKALSTETRMDILKLLSAGGRNPSFVAKKLGKSDATIVEHLQALERAGLVKKTVSPGRKWVFYSLTERGRGIASGKSRNLVIILAASLLAMLFGVGSFAGYMSTQFTLGTFAARAPAETAGTAETAEKIGATETAAGITATDITTNPSLLLYASMILLAASASGFGLYFYKKSKISIISM
jgi:DNA-binding transcriptional ArsR family regulator